MKGGKRCLEEMELDLLQEVVAEDGDWVLEENVFVLLVGPLSLTRRASPVTR